ncbi:putative quinol monooxygenase [Luteimonas sp. R10]|uniref:putative quinol monooxygenase n=1 Tax=Luteimonas sp. R10 TaxID=3108176 RepID=UPI00308C8E7D|nr:putative quinol monooxygenase [Luteimonas sp. R10]
MPTPSATPPRYGLIGTMRTKPGQRDAVVALLLRDVDDLSAVGCHLYLVGLDQEDSDLIRVVEVWDSKDAHRASLQLPGVRATIAEAMPLLTGEFTRTEFPAVGGLGLSE